MGAKCTRYGTVAVVYGNFGGANYGGGAIFPPKACDASYERWLDICEPSRPVSVPDYMYKLHDTEYGLARTRADVRAADHNLSDRLRKAGPYMDWPDFIITRLVILLYMTLAYFNIQNYTFGGEEEMAAKDKARPRLERMHAATTRQLDEYVCVLRMKKQLRKIK